MHEEKVFPNRNPLGVIIESIEDSSINIICKASTSNVYDVCFKHSWKYRSGTKL